MPLMLYNRSTWRGAPGLSPTQSTAQALGAIPAALGTFKSTSKLLWQSCSPQSKSWSRRSSCLATEPGAGQQKAAGTSPNTSLLLQLLGTLGMLYCLSFC